MHLMLEAYLTHIFSVGPIIAYLHLGTIDITSALCWGWGGVAILNPETTNKNLKASFLEYDS